MEGQEPPRPLALQAATEAPQGLPQAGLSLTWELVSPLGASDGGLLPTGSPLELIGGIPAGPDLQLQSAVTPPALQETAQDEEHQETAQDEEQATAQW